MKSITKMEFSIIIFNFYSFLYSVSVVDTYDCGQRFTYITGTNVTGLIVCICNDFKKQIRCTN